MIYGIGIDIVDIDRFKGVIERRGERFLKRVFTEGELDYCLAHRFPERHLAARFAGKASVLKALGRRFGFKDVEVLRDGAGRPFLNISGAVHSGDGLRYSISLSHNERFGMAETVVERVR